MSTTLGYPAQPSGQRSARGACKAMGTAGRSPVPAASGLLPNSTTEAAAGRVGRAALAGPAPGAARGIRAA